MSIAETAQLAVDLKLNTIGSFKGATSEIAGVEAAAARSTAGTGLLSRGFGAASGAASRFGGALSHAKSQLGGLISGPLGLVGLGAGLFTITGALEGGISKATEMGKAASRLAAITGLNVTTTSALSAAFEHFGIGVDKQIKAVAMLEKNVGLLTATAGAAKASASDLAAAQNKVTVAQEKLNVATLKLHEMEGKSGTSASSLAAARYKVRDATAALAEAEGKLTGLQKGTNLSVSQATEFYKKFGLALLDANGKVKDANTLILDTADYFNNKSIPAQTKAAALAKLYGRSWADLIPFLAAGRKGIQDAEEEATKFGLTLTKDNIGQLAKLREATRSWGTALGGLEVQIGLLVVGPLTDLANFGTEFIAKNRQGIQQFFQNLIHTAQDFAAFVTGTVVPTLMSIGDAAKSAWNAVPAPIRDLLVKGFIADKAVKFLFGFSPITFAKDALGGLAKGFFQRGGNPAMPLFVADVTGGLGGAAGAAAGAGGIGLLGAAGLGAIIVAAAVPIGQAFASALPDWLKGGPGPDTGKTQSQLAYEASHREQQGGTLRNASDRGLDSAAVRGIGAGIADRMLDSPLGKISASTITMGIKAALSNQFHDMLVALRDAKKPEDVAKAVKAAVELVITKQRGNVGGTQDVLNALKKQLSDTHDPKLQAALRDAIHKVEQKVVGREFVAKQIAAADKIAKSTESTKQKVADLTAIQKTLAGRSTHAIEIVQAKIDAAKRAQVAAQQKTTDAGWGTARAIQEKDLSVTVNTNVSVRDIFNGQKKISRVFVTAS